MSLDDDFTAWILDVDAGELLFSEWLEVRRRVALAIVGPEPAAWRVAVGAIGRALVSVTGVGMPPLDAAVLGSIGKVSRPGARVTCSVGVRPLADETNSLHARRRHDIRGL